MMRILCRRSASQLVETISTEQLEAALTDTNAVIWLDLCQSSEGIKQTSEFLTRIFHFHPLAIEDALLETHLSRVDDWQKYLYVSFHALEYLDHHIQQKELDIFVGPNFLVTIHFEPIEPLQKLWESVERSVDGRLTQTADRLLYHLFDRIATTSMQVVECLDDALDALEQDIFTKPRRTQLSQLFLVRRTVLQLRRIFGSQRETMNRMARDPFGMVHAENRVYFRDIYDHLVRMHELSDGLRDMASGALESHISMTSYRMNEVMKTLTIVTVLFMPLTFLTGYFGMNFFGEQFNVENPLSKSALFVVSMILMLLTPVLMLFWMRKRGWLQSQLSSSASDKGTDTLP
ncbi:MAG: magnesium/cobalt transporter CorA [Gemmatales bacterium]